MPRTCIACKGVCSELSVMVDACVCVGVVKLLEKWLSCGGHVVGDAVTGGEDVA